jgi:hypothetical protein
MLARPLVDQRVELEMDLVVARGEVDRECVSVVASIEEPFR